MQQRGKSNNLVKCGRLLLSYLQLHNHFIQLML